MPNLVYMLVNTAYYLALALWIGGAVVLGALVAPELFRQLPRPQAGGIFGPVLRRFARLRLAAICVAIGAATWKHLAWESHAANVWIALRWTCLALLALGVLYEIFALEPAMGRRRAAMAPDSGADDAHRVAFMGLHRRSEMLMKVSLFVAVVALFLG
jgi:hypothetical protein